MVDEILCRVNGGVNPADSEEGGEGGGVAAHHEEDKRPPGDYQQSSRDKTRDIFFTRSDLKT